MTSRPISPFSKRTNPKISDPRLPTKAPVATAAPVPPVVVEPVAPAAPRVEAAPAKPIYLSEDKLKTVFSFLDEVEGSCDAESELRASDHSRAGKAQHIITKAPSTHNLDYLNESVAVFDEKPLSVATEKANHITARVLAQKSELTGSLQAKHFDSCCRSNPTHQAA